MKILYFLLEGKPAFENKDKDEFDGVYINCWVKSEDENDAKNKAIQYINSQGWDVFNVEETFIATRDRYIDFPDSLECFDQAVDYGLGAIFNTWPIDSEDE